MINPEPHNKNTNTIITDDFLSKKIVLEEISDKPKFALDENGNYFIEAATFMMTGENLNCILLFLNSSLSEYYFSTFVTTTGVGTGTIEFADMEQWNESLNINLIISIKQKINLNH